MAAFGRHGLLSARKISLLCTKTNILRQLGLNVYIYHNKNLAICEHLGVASRCQLHTSSSLWDEADKEEDKPEGEEEDLHKAMRYKYEPCDVETSIRYLQSKAYEVTYKGQHVWVPYRRNHKGRLPPSKTRKTCVRQGWVSTGNPCPICRDENLILHPKNTELLRQFISPISGDIISYEKTGLCQKQHRALTIAVLQAWDLGYMERPLPFRQYDYSAYYTKASVSSS